MTDIKYWRRMAQIGENNANFYLQEIARITALYDQLLNKYIELDTKYKNLQKESTI